MPHLYFVATPIGHLGDITIRALETLRCVDVIVCEDTRVTRKLLEHFQISKPLLSVRQRGSVRDIERVLESLRKGLSAAYVTDAGTPGLSDPGGELIERVLAGLPETKIVPIPGPNAAAALGSVAGIPLDRYTVMGFPPHKKGRQAYFKTIIESPLPIFFYESVHRIRRTLREVADCLPEAQDRYCVIGRELTKMYEEILRGSLREFVNRPITEKGEFVVLVSRWKL
ncbi:16S rRNA (cytidine(1402)-2'-O)-methyltransferase [Candidatus Uhrbacteria bacterium]|nr:16S rRNA (cytidine(1402)-2'-O)-methyltransferase [Candidatus Uhrbacteria bacterium]